MFSKALRFAIVRCLLVRVFNKQIFIPSLRNLISNNLFMTDTMLQRRLIKISCSISNYTY